MKPAHMTRWATAGAALGLSAAVFAGAAFAAGPASTGRRAASPPDAAALAAATPRATTASTTTTAPDSSGPSSSQTPAVSGTMMSAMLADLSPQSQAQLRAIWPQMLQIMDSSHMMNLTASPTSMMGAPTAGGGSAGQSPTP